MIAHWVRPFILSLLFLLFLAPGVSAIDFKVSGHVNRMIRFADEPRISYDSNICINYGSASLFLPRNSIGYYDPRFVDETLYYLDKLTDAEFLAYMDWIWGEGPEPLAVPGSYLDAAIENAYWMTNAEIEEMLWFTEERDDFLYEMRERGLWKGFTGIFAMALLANPFFYLNNPIATNVEGGMVNIPPPVAVFSGTPSDEAINSITRYITPIGGNIITPENGNDWKIQVPVNTVYELDRYKIKADYLYGLQNNITDGSVPTITYDNDYSNYNTPYLNELTLAFEKALTDDLAVSLTGFYKRKHNLSLGVQDRGSLSEENTSVHDPGITQLEGSSSSTLPDDKSIGGDDITPRISLIYDLGLGMNLKIPYGKYNYSPISKEGVEEAQISNNQYASNIQFKVEESVLQGDQSSLRPAEETVVKLGFPIPPMPLEGNPRIDEGASDNPVQGEVDSNGDLNLQYDFHNKFGLGLTVGYNYNDVPPQSKISDASFSADDEVDEEGWAVDPNLVRVKLEFDGGMVQIDPPSLDLSNPPEVDSVIDDLFSTSPPLGFDNQRQDVLRYDSPSFGPVLGARSTFTDRVRLNFDTSFIGGDRLRTRLETGNKSGFKIAENNSPIPKDRIFANYNYFSETPLDVNLTTNQIASRIIFRDDANAPLGDLAQYTTQQFKLGGLTMNSLFFPAFAEAEVQAAIDNNEGIKRDDKNPYRDKQGNDPYFSSKGSWGQEYPDQWAIQHVGFTNDSNSAWVAAGNELSPVVVAVIDTGIDWNHADISWDAIWKNDDEVPDNGIDDDNNGYIDDVIGWDFFYNTNLPWDEDGHGTFVAGVIAAESDNDVGISGINPMAKIMVLKALDSFGHTRASYLVEAIAYAVDNGAQIINLSVGGEDLSYAEELAVQYAEDNGVLVVAAAGNKAIEASNFGFVPYETVITVGSTTIEDKKSGFSNWGKGIDIVAPGEDVLSLRARRTDLMLNVRQLEYEMGTAYVGDDNRYYRAAGTSFSTPIVAGIASLIWSKDPSLTHTEVRRMLLQTAKDIEVPGRDQLTGFGLVDATAALKADPEFEIIADIVGVEVVQEDGNLFVAVNGTANANDFKGAQLFIGAGENPDKWKAVGDDIKKIVSNGRLDRIAASELQGSAVWIIRLVVTHKDDKIREERYTLTLN